MKIERVRSDFKISRDFSLQCRFEKVYLTSDLVISPGKIAVTL